MFRSENTRKDDHKRDGKRDPGTARRNGNSTLRVKSRTMFDGRHKRLPVLGESRRSCGRVRQSFTMAFRYVRRGLAPHCHGQFSRFFFHSNWAIPNLSSNPGFILAGGHVRASAGDLVVHGALIPCVCVCVSK